MEVKELKVEPRDQFGKGAARKLRRRGLVPGVVYGHGEAPRSFSVDPVIMDRTASRSGYGRNTVFKLSGLDADPLVMVKRTARDPVRRDLVHVDLQIVKESDQVEAKVPVELTGRPVGIVKGGQLQVVRRQVTVRCAPLSVPSKIVHDISNFDLAETLHVQDLTFPEGVVSGDPPGSNYAIAVMKAPRTDKRAAAAETAAS